MSDTVSKLYAEIGFKVNQDGLKQAQRFLKSLHKQMSDLNQQTKEVAKQYGIFSANQNKQAMADERLATQKEKTETQRNKARIDNKKFEHKQLMDLAKLEFQVEKYNAAEKNKIERQQAREAEKAAKEQQKRLKETLSNFRSFAVGLRNTFLRIAGVAAGGMIYGVKQSLNRSIPTRDFTMTTGVSLPDLQEVMQRMANTGSGMSQQNIMNDIQRVSQNLADISLGQGELAPYKLLSVAAQRGDVMGVIKGVEQSIKHLDNAMALNLTRRVGLSDEWLAMWRYREREGGDQRQISREQQNAIIETEIALKQLKFAFKNLADYLASAFSPGLTRMFDGIRDWFQSLSAWIDEHPNTVNDLLNDLEKLAEGIHMAFIMIASACDWIAEKIGNIIKAPKILWDNSDIGKFFRGLDEGGMSKINPAFEDELLHWGNDKVKDFNNDRRTVSKNIINSTDNSVQNVTINGVAQEEIAQKAKEAVQEANKKEETLLQKKLYGAADLWVLAPTV